MDCIQLSKLLNTDDLCVDSEDSVFSCINFWLQSCNNSSNSNSSLIKDSDLINLWETVRFSHLSSDMMTQVVEKSEFFETIKKTESYQHTTLGSAMRACNEFITLFSRILKLRIFFSNFFKRCKVFFFC